MSIIFEEVFEFKIIISVASSPTVFRQVGLGTGTWATYRPMVLKAGEVRNALARSDPTLWHPYISP